MANPFNNGSEKAALVLLALGEEISAEIFKRLKENEVKKISSAISRIGRIADADLESVLNEFSKMLNSSKSSGLNGSNEFAQRVARLAFKGDHAQQLVDAIAATDVPRLESIDNADAETIASVIAPEHPQTMALIIAHAPPQKAAAIIKLLPEATRAPLLVRIANLDAVSPDAIVDLDDYLREAFDRVAANRQYHVGGIEHVAKMLGTLTDDERRQQLEGLGERDASLAEQIEDLLFTFDDISRLDPRNMSILIKSIPQADWLLAMKGAKKHVYTTFLTAQSERAQTQFQEDLEALGPRRKSDVEAKQKEIVAILRSLIEAGTVQILDKNDVFV